MSGYKNGGIILNGMEYIYPQFYMTGDIGWIMMMLGRLSIAEQRIESEKYRETYLTIGRDAANTALKERCGYLKEEVTQAHRVNVSLNDGAIKERINAIRIKNKTGDGRILAMADKAMSRE